MSFWVDMSCSFICWLYYYYLTLDTLNQDTDSGWTMPIRCQLRLQSKHQWWSSNRTGSLPLVDITVGGGGRWDVSSLGDLVTKDSSAPKDLSCCWCCNAPAIVVVQSLSHVWLFATPWTTAQQSSLSFTISQSLLKLMSIKSMTPSNHLILCRPLLLPPSIFPNIRVFSNESALCIRWPKYWQFSFSPSWETLKE